MAANTRELSWWGGPTSSKVSGQERLSYDIHGLVKVQLGGPNIALLGSLDRTLSPFRVATTDPDFVLELGTYPATGWEPTGSTVGDRMLYDSSVRQTTVFTAQLGNAIRKRDVQYVITGEPRVGTGPVTVNVPNSGRRVGRLRQAGIETLHLEGRRALLALAGDPIFLVERTEQEAEGILQTIFEPFLFYRLPGRDCTLVHGAALSSGGSGVLMLGLASVGKTSLALRLVKNGYMYYGDDLPIIARNGELISNPKPIKLRSQHIELFPELADTIIQGLDGGERILLSRGVRKHEPEFMRRLPRRSLDDIFRGAKIGDRVPLKTIIFLRRMTGKEFYVDELDGASLVRDTAADLFFQFPCAPWRRTMYYFCSSIAMGRDFMAEEEVHHRKITDILAEAFSSARVLRLNAPLDYGQRELEGKVLDALSSVH